MRYAKAVLAAALALFATTPVLASVRSDVLATVKQYDDAFNNNDMKGWAALCTDQTIIIDDFAPHVWQGANTCETWWNALAADEKTHAYSDVKVALEKPLHVMITGDRAYVVEPTVLTYKNKDKPTTAHGVWTLALQKQAAGWRVTGWAWADH